MLTVITSRQNTRVRELRAALRGRAPADTVAIEGQNLLLEAMGSGLSCHTVFLRQDRKDFADQLPADVNRILLSADAFDHAASTEHSQGIAALLRKPHHAYTPAANDLLVLAGGLQDPGNLGTLIRSAEALGAGAVLLAEQTVDPWNGKALRASAGSVFRMPLVPFTDALLASLRTHGIRLLAAVPATQGAIAAHDTDLRTGCAFLLGNEGSGLSPAMLALADARITLPMPGPTESLNAAVAGSLLLYEAARQRVR